MSCGHISSSFFFFFTFYLRILRSMQIQVWLCVQYDQNHQCFLSVMHSSQGQMRLYIDRMDAQAKLSCLMVTHAKHAGKTGWQSNVTCIIDTLGTFQRKTDCLHVCTLARNIKHTFQLWTKVLKARVCWLKCIGKFTVCCNAFLIVGIYTSVIVNNKNQSNLKGLNTQRKMKTA